MEKKSKFLQKWERKLQQSTHKCSECGSHRHSWRVCPAYFSDSESVQGEYDCSIEEMLQIFLLALIWWKNYLHEIYTYSAVCHICCNSGHSCGKKRNCPIRADKLLTRVYKKVVKLQDKDDSSDEDLQELFEQELREAGKQASRSTTSKRRAGRAEAQAIMVDKKSEFASPLRGGQSFISHQGKGMLGGMKPTTSKSGSGSRPPMEIFRQLDNGCEEFFDAHEWEDEASHSLKLIEPQATKVLLNLEHVKQSTKRPSEQVEEGLDLQINLAGHHNMLEEGEMDVLYIINRSAGF